MLQRLLLLLTVLALSGCAGIPLSSAYKMMTANPLEFHPDAIAVAVKRSNAIQLNTGDVRLSIHLKNKAMNLKQSGHFFLVVNNSPDISTLQTTMAKNETLTVLTLSPHDVVRMKALQQTMREHLRNGGSEDDFGFSIQVLEGCKNIKQVPKHVYVSLFLKLDARSDFFPLYQEFDIGQADLSPLKNLQDWDVCND